jgi:hypothetical protein
MQSKENNEAHNLFEIPLSYEAFEQFLQFHDIFDQTQWSKDNDVLSDM